MFESFIYWCSIYEPLIPVLFDAKYFSPEIRRLHSDVGVCENDRLWCEGYKKMWLMFAAGV